jgi:chromosome segregation ATPase
MDRENFKNKAKESIDDIFTKIDELEIKKDQLLEKAKTEYDEMLAGLKEKKEKALGTAKAEYEEKLAEVKAKKEKALEVVKSEYDEKIVDLKTKKDELLARYDRLAEATEENWEEVKDAFSSASESFKEGFRKIASLFD